MRISKRGLKITGIALAALIALFFVHPWLLAIPDRVAEWRMRHTVHVGMTRPQVEAALEKSGSSYDLAKDGTITAQYAHFITLCVGNGTEYDFLFNARNKLRSISVEPSGGAC